MSTSRDAALERAFQASRDGSADSLALHVAQMPHQENATTHHEITRKHEEHKKDLFWHRDVRNATWDVRRCELRRARHEMRATRRECARGEARGAHGNNGGGTRFFVACSNAYASSISFGSLH